MYAFPRRIIVLLCAGITSRAVDPGGAAVTGGVAEFAYCDARATVSRVQRMQPPRRPGRAAQLPPPTYNE